MYESEKWKWSRSVVSDSVGPHRQQLTRLHCPLDSPGKNTGVVCHFLLQCMQVKSERAGAQLHPTLSDPMTAAHQAPPSLGFSRQEYWSGVPLPSLPNIITKVLFVKWHLSKDSIFSFLDELCSARTPCLFCSLPLLLSSFGSFPTTAWLVVESELLSLAT